MNEELRNKVEKMIGTAILNNDKNYTDDMMAVIKPYLADENWWIASLGAVNPESKVLGPFATRELALRVREYVEKANKPHTYWVAKEV